MVSQSGIRVLYLATIALQLLFLSPIWADEPPSKYEPAESAVQQHDQPYDVHSWFHDYDLIRKHARMTLREKLQSRHLLIVAFDPLAMFTSEAEPLLKRMIEKYNTAIEDLRALPRLTVTSDLQDGYLHYFNEAKQLFSDTLEVEREPIERRHCGLHKLMERKKNLESLDQSNKELDAQLRKKYDIPPLKN